LDENIEKKHSFSGIPISVYGEKLWGSCPVFAPCMVNPDLVMIGLQLRHKIIAYMNFVTHQ